MKKILLLSVLCIILGQTFAQQQTFDITTFTLPPEWKKQATTNTIQLSKEDPATGTFCLITLYKAIPGTTNAKENFDLAWESLVKEMVTVSTQPEMQPAATEDGWEIQSGYAPFESDGNKGIAMLVTASSLKKMVNMIILTNTDVYEKEMTAFLESVSLKKSEGNTPNTIIQPVSEPPVATLSVKQDGFAFATTNFDDGWNSTVQEDWVKVTKGNINVLLHYPKEGTIFSADPEPLTIAAWNILVAPRYSNLKNFKTSYITTYDRPYLGFGYATENATGKEVYIVLYRQGQTGWLEFITPDKNAFEQFFKFDPDAIQWNSETALLNPLAIMVNYNKFAVAASDFNGRWTSDFTGIQQMYHVYTGQYAGMNTNQSKEEFDFKAGNNYNWKLLVVDGMVGTMRYNQVKSSGNFSIPNNWQVKFSMIENRARTYHAFWSCIKGARILNLLDADSPGQGIYTRYGIAK